MKEQHLHLKNNNYPLKIIEIVLIIKINNIIINPILKKI